jgi:hypothetical protein
VCQWQVAAGLIYGQVKKSRPSTEAGSRHACDAPWHRSCSHQRIAETSGLTQGFPILIDETRTSEEKSERLLRMGIKVAHLPRDIVNPKPVHEA